MKILSIFHILADGSARIAKQRFHGNAMMDKIEKYRSK